MHNYLILLLYRFSFLFIVRFSFNYCTLGYRYLLDRDSYVIQRLLPFTEYADSLVRRGGIVGTLKNCCFDVESHEWLLSPEVDILSCLLLPLAGPEEFDDEDNDKLPISLQYLPETKQREPDLDIR